MDTKQQSTVIPEREKTKQVSLAVIPASCQGRARRGGCEEPGSPSELKSQGDQGRCDSPGSTDDTGELQEDGAPHSFRDFG